MATGRRSSLSDCCEPGGVVCESMPCLLRPPERGQCSHTRGTKRRLTRRSDTASERATSWAIGHPRKPSSLAHLSRGAHQRAAAVKRGLRSSMDAAWQMYRAPHDVQGCTHRERRQAWPDRDRSTTLVMHWEASHLILTMGCLMMKLVRIAHLEAHRRHIKHDVERSMRVVGPSSPRRKFRPTSS